MLAQLRFEDTMTWHAKGGINYSIPSANDAEIDPIYLEKVEQVAANPLAQDDMAEFQLGSSLGLLRLLEFFGREGLMPKFHVPKHALHRPLIVRPPARSNLW